MNFQRKDRLITRCGAPPTLMADCDFYEQGAMLCTHFRFDFCCTKLADKKGGETGDTASQPANYVTSYQI